MDGDEVSSNYTPSTDATTSSDDEVEEPCSIDEIIRFIKNDESNKVTLFPKKTGESYNDTLCKKASGVIPFNVAEIEIFVQEGDGSLTLLNEGHQKPSLGPTMGEPYSSTSQVQTITINENGNSSYQDCDNDYSVVELGPSTEENERDLTMGEPSSSSINVENEDLDRAIEITNKTDSASASCDGSSAALNHECDETLSLPESYTEERRKRASMGNKTEWQRKKSKESRLKGEGYIGYRRQNKQSTKVILHDAPREPRAMRATCDSPNCAKWKTRLCNTISEEERANLFKDFWKKMSWDTKKMFVISTVKIEEKKQKTTGQTPSRRSSTYSYHLRVNGKNVPVCQKMYLNTLGLSKNSVHYWVGNFRKNNLPSQSKNVAQRDRENESGEEVLQQPSSNVPSEVPTQSSALTTWVQKALTLDRFFAALQFMDSHYCRKSTKKKYLQGDIKTWTQLFGLYMERCKELQEGHVSRYTFDRVRKSHNIDIHQPKKDRCDTCLSFETKNITQEAYNEHIKKKNLAREEKAKDKIAAQEGRCYTVCCDLMAVQTCPMIRASSAYYKLKLAVHNYTVYDLSTHDACTYWFDETQSKMCASTFASCLVDYLSELLEKEKKPIIIFTDGCNYQNRNSVLSNALLHLSVYHRVTIMQKFLEKGHTQMECDSVHSVVEKEISKMDIFLPSEFAVLSKLARKLPMPYRSKHVDHKFFHNFDNTLAYPSIRPGRAPGDPTVTDLRVILYEPNGRISFKLSFDDENFQNLPIRPKKIEKLMSFQPLHQSRPKIPLDKYNDLQALKKFLPSYAHQYYDELPHEQNSQKFERAQEKKKNIL